LWLDEALTVNIARLPIGQIGSALLRDGHPPLYYWALHGWMQIFGAGDLAVRSLSAMFGLATLPLVWILGRRSGGPRVGTISLVLLAISPYAVRYGTEARMYSLVMLLVAGGGLLLDEVLARPRWWNVVGLVLVVGALLWTHYWSIYLIATAGTALLVLWGRRPLERPTLRWAIGALVAGGVLFVPWLPNLLQQARRTGTPWAGPSRPTQVVQTTLAELGGGGFAEALLLGTLLAMVAVFVLVGGSRDELEVTPPDPAQRLEPRVLLGVIAMAMGLGTAASYVTASGFAPRYASIIVPFAIVVVAAGGQRITPAWLQRTLMAGLVGLSVVAVVHNVTDQRTQSGAIATRLVGQVGDGDLVVVCPDQLGPDLERQITHLGLQVSLFVYPDGRDPRFVDWRDYQQRNHRADPSAFVQEVLARAGDRPIWIVWQGGYRTLIGQCEAVVDGLTTARPHAILVRASDAFEPASLWRFG
jgi:uncharacterized membrane protein